MQISTKTGVVQAIMSSLLDLAKMIKPRRPQPQVPFGCILFMGTWRNKREEKRISQIGRRTLSCCPLTALRIEYGVIA
jgi:hypothetical protein